MSANTLFLRLEGHLQSWGDQQSKFVIRRTAEAPTKSGVIGMLCAALGISRSEASLEWLPKLSALRMGVRIDRQGARWWDYHTVGAKIGLLTAEDKIKRTAKTGEIETLVTRREYLADAGFLVALQGDPDLIGRLEDAVRKPKWILYLGRKCCPPGRPLLEHPAGDFPDLLSALNSVPWRRRLRGDEQPESVDCLLDWAPTSTQPEAPDDALVWYDVPLSFKPPAHSPRFVIRETLSVGADCDVGIAETPSQKPTPRPIRTWPDYQKKKYKERRKERLRHDHHLCVFCKSPATNVHHVTYRRAGGDELLEDLRSLCHLCHDAMSMIEYGAGMGPDRIDPCDPSWREQIKKKRDEITEYRSLETRRRRLQPEEVE